MPRGGRRFVLDASALITFAKNGQLDLLVQVVARRAHVTDEVRGECVSLRTALDATIDMGDLEPFTISDPDDVAFFARVRTQMDAGEASAVVAARRLAGTVISDDRDAIVIGRELLGEDRVIGTREVLCLAVGRGLVTPVQAAVHLDTFIRGGAWVPDAPEGYFVDCVGVP